MFRTAILAAVAGSLVTACSWNYKATERPNQLTLTVNDISVDYTPGDILVLNVTIENAGDHGATLFLDGSGHLAYRHTKPWMEYTPPSLCAMAEQAPDDEVHLDPGAVATFAARFHQCGENPPFGADYFLTYSVAFDNDEETQQITSSNTVRIEVDKTSE